MPQEIHEIFLKNPEAAASLGFLIGLLLGHWLHLGRDKRQEFNKAATPISITLLNEAKDPSPMTAGLTDIEAKMFIELLYFWQRKRFYKTWNDYSQLKKNSIIRDSFGGASYENKSTIIEHIQNLLQYTKRR